MFDGSIPETVWQGPVVIVFGFQPLVDIVFVADGRTPRASNTVNQRAGRHRASENGCWWGLKPTPVSATASYAATLENWENPRYRANLRNFRGPAATKELTGGERQFARSSTCWQPEAYLGLLSSGERQFAAKFLAPRLVFEPPPLWLTGPGGRTSIVMVARAVR